MTQSYTLLYIVGIFAGSLTMHGRFAGTLGDEFAFRSLL